MNRRTRTLLLAAPLLTLASCQLVSGLSSVDLDGTGTSGGMATGGTSGGDICANASEKEAQIACQAALVLDEDLIQPGTSCTTLVKSACQSACAKDPVLGAGLVGFEEKGCLKPATMSCVNACERACDACPSGKVDCFRACDESCTASCKGQDCSSDCAGGCASACATESSCSSACTAACKIVDSEESCLRPNFGNDATFFTTACKNSCGQPQLFCDGVWLGVPASHLLTCKTWLRAQGATIH